MKRVDEEEEEVSSEGHNSLLEEMAPESGNGTAMNGTHRFGKVSSVSSIDSIDQDQDAYFSDCPSDDLDKLSMCLSEVSSENASNRKTSLLSDIIQAQLALWTLIFSIFYSYAWQQHRKKFLFSLFVVVPPVILVCCTMSSLLTAIVILGRIFSAPLRIQDIFKFGQREEDEVQTNLGSNYGGSGSIRAGSLRRRRSMSGNSCHSSVSNRSSCEELPKPVCRKHSTSQHAGSSLSLVCGTPTSPPLGNGFSNGFVNGCHNGNGFSFHGLNNSRSLSASNGQKAYQFSHSVGGVDN